MPADLVLALVLVSVGAFLQGTVGFGMNLVAAPLLIVIDPRFVPGPLLVGAVVLTAATVFRERGALRLDDVSWAFVGRVPGAVVGALAVAAMSQRALALILSVVVLAAVAVSVAGVHVPVTRSSLVSAGIVSGFTGTTTAIGGPPMGLLLQHRDGDDVRANLAGYFLLGAIMSIALLAVTGSFGSSELLLGLLVGVPVLLGFTASGWTAGHVKGRRVRPAVLTVAGVSATVLLVRTLAS